MKTQIINFFIGVGISTTYITTAGIINKFSAYFK